MKSLLACYCLTLGVGFVHRVRVIDAVEPV